ncbi:C40 family peptidase [Streptomyces ziwulingensis]|uniref:C40 family peptidase n=2 Tax=Streptomyces ziwulingensis TaxID=1045501 RepID=A0ABP9AU05_9ACTN
MRAGVAGGVLSTLAVAGASGSANAAEPVTQTLELPILTADLAAQAAQSADATQQAAADYELRAARDAAAAEAAKEAKADLKEAKQKAAEAKKKAEQAARKAAAERASRDTERATLTATASVDTGSDSGDTGGSSVSTGTSAATGSAAAVVSFVQAQVGKAYVSGATGPSAYDCSGLVQAAFKQVGVSLPRVSQDQSVAGTQVSLDNLQPGDILYWGGAGSAYHVGVYIGDGQFVGAQNSSTGVVQKSLSYDPPSGAVRVL